MDHAEDIRRQGWRQGSILLPEHLALPERTALGLPADALLLVLSHDCDLVQPDFDKEPHVELLVLHPIARADGNFAHGRHPRTLDFTLGEASFRASCHERHRLPRTCLVTCSPSEAHPVNDALCDLVTQWIAKRYTRPAFPDAFNVRLSRDHRAIKRYFQTHGHHFRNVLINCDPRNDELTDGAPYQVVVWLVLALGATLSPHDRQQRVVELEKLLAACPGIEIGDCRIVTEDDVTLAHLRYLAPWDFDYLTHREALDPTP